MKRTQRNYLAVDARMAESDPNDWTEEQHHRLQLMMRYKVAAERSFHRSVTALEQFRRTRVYEAIALQKLEAQVVERERRDSAEAEEDEPEMTVQEQMDAVPKFEKVPSLTQYVTVRVVEEKTVTTMKPSNEELLEASRTMEEAPVRVFRSITIQPWLPEEYAWVKSLPGKSNSRTQVMQFEEWARAVEREQEIEGGHIGPAELDADWLSWWRAAFRDLWELEEESGGTEKTDQAERWGAKDAAQTNVGETRENEQRWTEGDPGTVGGGADSQREDGNGIDAGERRAR